MIQLPECRQQVYATESEWLDARAGLGTASMAPALFGDQADVWGTPLSVYLRLRGGDEPFEPSIAMRAGHAMEPLIAQLFEEESGLGLQDPGDYTMQVNSSDSRLACTLDRLTDGEPAVIVEMKNVGARMLTHWQTDNGGPCIPLGVRIQVQHQMMVTGLTFGYVAAVLDNRELVVVPEPRNEEFITYNLRPKWLEMFEMVELGYPPSPTAADLGAVKAMYPNATPQTMTDLPDRAIEVAQQWVAAKDLIKAQKLIRDEAEASLRIMMGDVELGRFPDGSGLGLSLLKTERKAYTSVHPAASYRTLRAKKGLK